MKKGIAFLLAAILGVSFGLAAAYFFQITKVGDSTMAPTLAAQDTVLIARRAYTSKSPRCGDLVLVDAVDWVYGSRGEGSTAIKRIIATPGDRVGIYDGIVFVNGYAAQEDYLQEQESSGSMSPVVLKEGEYFVMGDNRAASTDSRSDGVGAICEDEILGEVILW